MAQNGTSIRTYAGPTPQQVSEAAALCYLDELRDEEIARKLGVCRRTLARWKRRSDFQVAYGAAALVGNAINERQFWAAWERQNRERAALWTSPRRG